MSEPITTESRRLERERAMSLLYEAEMKAVSVQEVVETLPVQPSDFVKESVLGVYQMLEEADSAIAQNAVGWELDRIGAVETAILRLAVFELFNRDELSTAVIISEAVELTKRFSTEESSKFVNGVLSAVSVSARGA